jgi:hypothetical protein
MPLNDQITLREDVTGVCNHHSPEASFLICMPWSQINSSNTGITVKFLYVMTCYLGFEVLTAVVMKVVVQNSA